MITFHPDLYVSDKLKKRENRIRRSLRMRRGTLGVYLICINNGSDQFDIFNAGILKQKHFRKVDLKIIGLCDSMSDAETYIEHLLEDVLKETGRPDMKSYMMKGFQK